MKLSCKEQEELKQLQANNRLAHSGVKPHHMPITEFRRMIASELKAEAHHEQTN